MEGVIGSAEPAQRCSRRASASSLSCRSWAVRPPVSVSTFKAMPTGTASAARPVRRNLWRGFPASPARSVSHCRTASASSLPPNSRRSAIRSVASVRMVQSRTLRPSTGPRCSASCRSATEAKAWSMVRTAPGAAGHPSSGVMRSRPCATGNRCLRVDRGRSIRSAPKRSLSASHAPGVWSLWFAKCPRIPAPRSSSGRSVRITSHSSPARLRNASRMASDETHGRTCTRSPESAKRRSASASGTARRPITR
ncbi:hypothetical protein D9M72_480090 [compost metagenome]